MCRHSSDLQCPYYVAPRYVVVIDKNGVERDYESAAMCAIFDKYCLSEVGQHCDEYEEFLVELATEEIQNRESQPR